MLLSDVYNSALQECTKASTLVGDTNEFFNSHIESNGITYSSELHSCIVDGAFLVSFMAARKIFGMFFYMLYDGSNRYKWKCFSCLCFPTKRRKSY